MPDAAAAMGAVIENATLTGGTFRFPPSGSANMFLGAVHSEKTGVPRKSLFLVESGGPPPWMRFGAATRNIRRHWVTLYVRGEPNALEATRDLAEELWVLLQRGTVTGFFNCVTRGEPIYLTTNPTDLPLFSLRFELWSQT